MIRALIVEDDLLSREVLCDLLKDHFPCVRIDGLAGSVKEALQILEKSVIDLLFLDIGLPDGDGPDILDALKNISFEVIVLTTPMNYREGLSKIKGLDYLIKPLTAESLRKSIKRFQQKRNSG
jgi:two-component system, LytTR family, response regulator